jgi:alpha-ketoglutarate-dependent 2,4-dichlorophenoxyacetate dioxygenase
MLQVRQLHPAFAAEIGGLDLGRPLDAAQLSDVRDAIDRYAVLVFPDQHLDNDSQAAFGRQFGELEASAQTYRADNKFRPEARGVVDVSNLDENNRPRALDDRRRLENMRNMLWHTDASFRAVPAALSMLYAHVVTPAGGETEFADLRAAYDALPDETKAQIADLVAEHSHVNSRAILGFPSGTPEERAALPPVPQRVVRRHPGSGRRTLYIGSHASHIVGWPVPDGRLLLLNLLEHATQREFVYRHQWRKGDLVLWDNRCTLHRGRPFDPAHPRDLRRVTTRDVASTLDQPA